LESKSFQTPTVFKHGATFATRQRYAGRSGRPTESGSESSDCGWKLPEGLTVSEKKTAKIVDKNISKLGLTMFNYG